ncbi:Smr domain-containing protein [Entamoeba marina]
MPPKFEIKPRKRQTYYVEEFHEMIQNTQPSEPVYKKPKPEKIPKRLQKIGQIQEMFPDIPVDVIEMFFDENDRDIEKTTQQLLSQLTGEPLDQPQRKQKQLKPNKSTHSRVWKTYAAEQRQQHCKSDVFNSTISEVEKEEIKEEPKDVENNKQNMADKMKLSYLIDLFSGVVDEKDIKDIYRLVEGDISLCLYILSDGKTELKNSLHISDEVYHEVTENQQTSYLERQPLPSVRGMKKGEGDMAYVERMTNSILSLAKERGFLSRQLAMTGPGSQNGREYQQRIGEISREIQWKQENVMNVYIRMLLRKTGDHSSGCLEIDLHGFSENEAITALQRTLDTVGITGIGKVRFITGMGKHSASGYSVIKQKMRTYLMKNGVRFDEDNASIVVYMK